MQLAALALGERLGDRGAGARDRLTDVPGLGGARVQHDPGGPDLLADAQRVRQRGERFRADVGIVAGAVEQVDGVDQDRVDRAVGQRLAEGRDVLLAVDASGATCAATG